MNHQPSLEMPAVYTGPATFFHLGHSLQTEKKRLEALGSSQKLLYYGEGFDLKYFGKEIIECKKIIFQVFI